MSKHTKQLRGFYDALKMLDRRARRAGRPRDRMQVVNAILAGIEVAILDAHMSGRVYSKGGEKAEPGDEHRQMVERAKRQATVAMNRAMDDWPK